jgi:hypothetical protein
MRNSFGASKPLLIGEVNPRNMDPEYALYPLPLHRSGGRLAGILGLTSGSYLARFDRVNLCNGCWDKKEAEARAAEIILGKTRPLVLLGKKVCNAFGVGYVPFTRIGPCYILPHPSKLARIWHNPGSKDKARALLAPYLVAPVE